MVGFRGGAYLRRLHSSPPLIDCVLYEEYLALGAAFERWFWVFLGVQGVFAPLRSSDSFSLPS